MPDTEEMKEDGALAASPLTKQKTQEGAEARDSSQDERVADTVLKVMTRAGERIDQLIDRVNDRYWRVRALEKAIDEFLQQSDDANRGMGSGDTWHAALTNLKVVRRGELASSPAEAVFARMEAYAARFDKADKSGHAETIRKWISDLQAGNFALAANQCKAGYSGEAGDHMCHVLDALRLCKTGAEYPDELGDIIDAALTKATGDDKTGRRA
jgi:hypothetical protein